MRRFVAACGLVCLALASGPAAASVLINIDKTTQRMSVIVDGSVVKDFVVSTGRAGYGTPNGAYRAQWLARSWFSKKYYNSPMPYSIFFHEGFAIHGSYAISQLGGPASHGCIRLRPSNAAELFALVQREGVANTQIVISGSSPSDRIARNHVRPKVRVATRTVRRGEAMQNGGASPQPQERSFFSLLFGGQPAN